MKYAVISSKATKKCTDALCSLGYCILPLPPFDRLSEPVNTHADMLFFSHKKTIITHRDYLLTSKDVFDTLCSECGFSLALTDDDIRPDYPCDITFNAIALNGVLYSNTRFTSRFIADLFSEKVTVKQGYTACSTLALSDTGVITADRSLASAYAEHGISVTLIKNGSISLPPYDCGFIGGASGVDGNTVFFSGDINSHEDANTIKSAIEQNGMKHISLSDEPLFDVGGIRFFSGK